MSELRNGAAPPEKLFVTNTAYEGWLGENWELVYAFDKDGEAQAHLKKTAAAEQSHVAEDSHAMMAFHPLEDLPEFSPELLAAIKRNNLVLGEVGLLASEVKQPGEQHRVSRWDNLKLGMRRSR